MRAHGRIQTSIWMDEEFLALPAEPQRMFMFLLSQPDMSQAGMLPLRARKWAQKWAGGTPEAVREALGVLEAGRFVLVDDDTEEVMVRTFVRGDGVFRQPKVMLRMREDFKEIESRKLRESFLRELRRLPLDELSDEPGGRGRDMPSVREQVVGIVESILVEFDVTEPSLDPVADPSGTLPVPIGKGIGNPSETLPVGTRVRAGAFPQPPTPIPQPQLIPSPAAPARPPSGFEEFWSTYPRRVGKDDAVKAYDKALRRASAAQILLGAHRMANDPNLPEKQFIPHPATWLNRGGWQDEPYPAAGRPGDGRGDALREAMARAQAAVAS